MSVELQTKLEGMKEEGSMIEQNAANTLLLLIGNYEANNINKMNFLSSINRVKQSHKKKKSSDNGHIVLLCDEILAAHK